MAVGVCVFPVVHWRSYLAHTIRPRKLSTGLFLGLIAVVETCTVPYKYDVQIKDGTDACVAVVCVCTCQLRCQPPDVHGGRFVPVRAVLQAMRGDKRVGCVWCVPAHWISACWILDRNPQKGRAEDILARKYCTGYELGNLLKLKQRTPVCLIFGLQNAVYVCPAGVLSGRMGSLWPTAQQSPLL